MPRISPQQLRTADTLDALARHFDLDDGDLASAVGMSRAAVQHRRGGRRQPRTPMSIQDVERFAEAFHVPFDVLLMDRAKALLWVLSNAPDGGLPTRSERPELEVVNGEGDADQGGPVTARYRGRTPRSERRLRAVS